MKYFILLIFILGGVAFKLHLENDQLLSNSSPSINQVTIKHAKSKLNTIKVTEPQIGNTNHAEPSDLSEKEPDDEELPDNQQITDLAEDHQRGIDEIESESEYEQIIRKKMYEDGSDFISLNKKKIKDFE